MAKPVEKKVTAATAGAYVASTALLAGLAAVQEHAELVSFLPDGLAPFVLAIVPTAITFVAGWAKRNNPRSIA